MGIVGNFDYFSFRTLSSFPTTTPQSLSPAIIPPPSLLLCTGKSGIVEVLLQQDTLYSPSLSLEVQYRKSTAGAWYSSTFLSE